MPILARYLPPIKILTKVAPTLSKIVVFGSACSVYRDLKKNNFVKRVQCGFIVGIGDGTKGYHVFISDSRTVITNQYIRDIETLDKEQNKLLQRRSLRGYGEEVGNSIACDELNASAPNTRSGSKNTPVWTIESPVTRSMHTEHASGQDVHQEADAEPGVVSSIYDVDPSNYRKAIQREDKCKWEVAMHEEIEALKNNHVW